MTIIKHRKIFYILSGLLVAASLFAIFNFGLKQGVDFTGGALIEVEYENVRPEIPVLKEKTAGLEFGNILLQPSGETGLIIRAKELTEDEHQKLISELSSLGPLNEVRFDSVGPIIGKELRSRSWIAIFLVVIMIILYVAFAFRKISAASHGMSSFNYGIIAVVALTHDVAISAGVFAMLGKYFGVEIDILFVTALLTILGFSVNDTIVTFDRVRENLQTASAKDDFGEVVGNSINQTLARSINTSFTALLVLGSIFFFAGESTRYFALALIIGIITGTYSSIFLASPLLVTTEKWHGRKGLNR
jgi:preprotein translocase subunit SecF